MTKLKENSITYLKGKGVHYDDECDLTNEWWQKFNSLTDEQSATLKAIIAKNHFTEEDYNTNDAAILEVLEYYKGET